MSLNISKATSFIVVEQAGIGFHLLTGIHRNSKSRHQKIGFQSACGLLV
jgi:hypothetical protein